MTDRARWVALFSRPWLRTCVVLALWLAATAAAVARVAVMVSDPNLPGEPWQTTDGHFRDFRDVIWTPGRYLLGGGNPYDPGPYLAAHPWAQQFSPYPPVWLVLGVVLAPLPFLVSAVVFQALSLGVAVVMLRVVCTWALPRLADVAVPAGLLWINIWYPGRGSLASLGSVLVVLGVALVLRSVTRLARTGDPVAGSRTPPRRPAVDVSCAIGIALALIKPQFGLLVALAAVVGGRAREVWRGAVGLAIACVPIFIVVSIAAGGPLAFLQSVRRDLIHVSTGDAPGALGSPFQRRFDLLGVLDYHGLHQPPAVLLLGVPVLAAAIAILVVRLTPNPFWVSTAVCAAVLVGFLHPWYDLLLMIIPVAVGAGMAIRGELAGVASKLAWVCCVLVVFHLHSVSRSVIPGLSERGADTIDLVLVCAALLCVVCEGLLAVRALSMPARPGQHAAGPAHGAGGPGPRPGWTGLPRRFPRR